MSGRRLLAAIGLLGLGAAGGGSLGAGWYMVFGSGRFGDGLEGLAEMIAGAAAGALAGAFTGWYVVGPAHMERGTRAQAVAGFLVAAAIFVVGLAYVGDWTNADGPGNVAAYAGILGLPAGAALFVITARRARRAESNGGPRN
ncbi:MAG: hypothetical protein ABR575_01330 [Actinomycetota bacterium]